jgi:outer membrane protein assembly factor BamD (BamD/ComL family)
VAELGATPKAATSLPRGRRSTVAVELADQIALVDASRAALASGAPSRALALANKYQMSYPTGAFRPEVTAVKIEALVKMGRTADARAAAERFAGAFGPGPLADRVARLAGLAQP